VRLIVVATARIERGRVQACVAVPAATRQSRRAVRIRVGLAAGEVLGRPKRCKLAHAFLWEYYILLL
jgi:hypothetical protein